MSALQDEFRERITRDVTRILRHIVGSEQQQALDGDIVLRIEGGKLVKVEFPIITDSKPALIHSDFAVSHETAEKMGSAMDAQTKYNATIVVDTDVELSDYPERAPHTKVKRKSSKAKETPTEGE